MADMSQQSENNEGNAAGGGGAVPLQPCRCLCEYLIKLKQEDAQDDDVKCETLSQAELAAASASAVGEVSTGEPSSAVAGASMNNNPSGATRRATTRNKRKRRLPSFQTLAQRRPHYTEDEKAAIWASLTAPPPGIRLIDLLYCKIEELNEQLDAKHRRLKGQMDELQRNMNALRDQYSHY
ncbi:hypothetical protein PT974_01869 [Cladobotryum mycophilum]|uniref:BZIP domain-containing protein n=1 Tax=Cladobotryum mycophilum TaxID=491253 RepID=A0ABR0SWT1_9HYPO